MKYLKFLLYGIIVAIAGMYFCSLWESRDSMWVFMSSAYGWIVTVVCTGIICSKLDKLIKKDKPDDDE